MHHMILRRKLCVHDIPSRGYPRTSLDRQRGADDYVNRAAPALRGSNPRVREVRFSRGLAGCFERSDKFGGC